MLGHFTLWNQWCVLCYRSEASLLLRRVRQEDHGSYTFHFSNSFFSGSQNIDLQIYRKSLLNNPEISYGLMAITNGQICYGLVQLWMQHQVQATNSFYVILKYRRFSKCHYQCGEKHADLQQLWIPSTHNHLVQLPWNPKDVCTLLTFTLYWQCPL